MNTGEKIMSHVAFIGGIAFLAIFLYMILFPINVNLVIIDDQRISNNEEQSVIEDSVITSTPEDDTSVKATIEVLDVKSEIKTEITKKESQSDITENKQETDIKNDEYINSDKSETEMNIEVKRNGGILDVPIIDKVINILPL